MLPRLIFTSTFFALFLCAAMQTSADARQTNTAKDPEPGVARELARWRAAHYRDVRYALQVELRPGAEKLEGKVEIRVVLDDEGAANDLALDWRILKSKDGQPLARVWGVEVNGRAVAASGADFVETGARDGAAAASGARFINEHIVVARELLTRGENVVKMSFESPISDTGGAAVTRYRDREDNSEYLYTLFVPSDASTAFPCFDQPDLKARFRLSVAAPKSWTVVSNTNAETTTFAGAAPKFIRFAETEPISTYVFAFAAGEFASFADDASPLGTRLFVRKSKAERARKELAEVFRINREGVAYFEKYFDRKFPFPKYDLVLLPEFPFRGMEHAGATFLREESILFPTDPTANDLWSRADVMLHEAAHQWFGDLVTMRWFDDLWLKEGFATFMASKAVEALLPDKFDAWKVFHQRTKPLAYDTDATKGTTPVWQEIANLSAAKSAYGNIVYRKAPSVLRQAEFYLGAEKFQGAVRLFVKEHAFKNAEWNDLVKAFEQTSGQKLDAWAEAWVKRRGMPEVSVEWGTDAAKSGRINRFTLRQRDVLGEDGAWPMRVKILLAYDDAGGARREARGKSGEASRKSRASASLNGEAAPTKFETLTVTLDAHVREQRVREAIGKRRPAFVFANYEDYGYGRFRLDDASRAYVLAHMNGVDDDFLRALLWGSLWESVREAELAPAAYIALAVKNVAREADEVTAQAILSRVETAFNRYLSGEQRRALAPRLEAMLYAQMMNAKTAGLRITYFRAYRQTATADTPAFDRLMQIRDGKLSVPGMTLRPRDRVDITTPYLAAFGGRGDDDETVKSLLASLEHDSRTDDERRYAYAARAALPTATNKEKYFRDFLHDKNLAESWIEAAVVPFNNPRHADLTLPHLDAALRELPALKRTRKIFFVNAWLAAFLGGQCGESASNVVRDFLAREPSLDRDLRLKVLEAADGLERCVRIREKFKVQGSKFKEQAESP